MKVSEVKQAIGRFIRDHQTAFVWLGSRQTQLLELGATVGVIQHYKSAGFTTKVVNPVGAKGFTVKLGTRGHPCDYSRVVCSKDNRTFEIHSNVSVRGARNPGVYCVDVGVVKEGAIPLKRSRATWTCIRNEDLVTFAEAKKLVVYPMLLAQFIGIVHELLPAFLGKRRRLYGPQGHIPPCLIALGTLSGNSQSIIDHFGARRFQLLVAEGFDFRLSAVKRNFRRSPFYLDDDSFAPPAAG